VNQYRPHRREGNDVNRRAPNVARVVVVVVVVFVVALRAGTRTRRCQRIRTSTVDDASRAVGERASRRDRVTPERPATVSTCSSAMTPDAPEREAPSRAKPRLAIKKMVLENFKSYAGAQHVGPFHKVR